jgi:glycosyltransferase involved in cell wall biosynthesis
MSDMVLPISKWLEGEVKKKIPGMPTEVLYSGISSEAFFVDEPFEWEHPAVGILQNHGILPKTKGLLEFSRIIERMPHVHFYIAAGQSWRQEYMYLVREALGKYPNVHFTQEMPYPDGSRKFLSSCDVYVLASKLDSLGTSVLEASLCERPVLASRVGGVPEIVREGETGWTIPNENVDEWVDKISLLLEDRALSGKMGKEGRKFVAERFSWKVIAKKLEGILKS